jgi:hypothetical protein
MNQVQRIAVLLTILATLLTLAGTVWLSVLALEWNGL